MATTNTTHTKTSMTVAVTHTISPKRYCANACWTPHSRTRRLLRAVLPHTQSQSAGRSQDSPLVWSWTRSSTGSELPGAQRRGWHRLAGRLSRGCWNIGPKPQSKEGMAKQKIPTEWNRRRIPILRGQTTFQITTLCNRSSRAAGNLLQLLIKLARTGR